MYTSGFLRRTIESSQIFMRRIMRSMSDPQERFAILHRWRIQQVKTSTHMFEVDPGAVLARGILGSQFIPFQIYVHNPEHCAYISREIAEVGFWEAVKTMRVIRLMDNVRLQSGRENATFVDVGANIGWYSLAVASQGFPVVAIEPAAYNTDLLKASIELNSLEDLLKVHQVLVTDKLEERSCLRLAPYGNPKVNRANFQITTFCDDDDDDSNNNGLRSTTIDQIVSNGYYNDIHVIKLDIEGYEAKALRGAMQLLRSENPPCFVILEYIPAYLKMAGEENPNLLFSELMRLGYELYPDSPNGDLKTPPIRELTSERIVGGRDYELRWPYGRCAMSSL